MQTKYRFLTNFNMFQYEDYVAQAKEFNKRVGYTAVTVSKKVSGWHTEVEEGTCGSIWHCMDFKTNDLNAYHIFCDQYPVRRYVDDPTPAWRGEFKK